MGLILVFYNLFNISGHDETKQTMLELIFIDYAWFNFVSYFCRIFWFYLTCADIAKIVTHSRN